MSVEFRPRFLSCDSNIGLHSSASSTSLVLKRGSATCERRLYSSILAEFPWYSEAIVLKPQSISTNSVALVGYETFLTSFCSFETSLFDFNGASNVTETLALLGINVIKTTVSNPSYIAVSAHPPTPSHSHFQKLCSVLCAYRFFEIISLRAQCISRNPIPFPPSCIFLPGHSAKDIPEEFSRLKDWPSLVVAFQRLVSGAKQGSAISRVPTFTNPMFSLMHMAADNNSATKYRAIEENFLLAAIHLAAMKNIPFAEGTLPDLPSNMPSVPPGGFQDQESCERFEMEYNAFLDKCRTEGCISAAANVALRLPFQLALLISPLFLFSKFRLSKRLFHRRTVIDFAARLGPHKPPCILAVESVIWDAIFRLSEGQTPVNTVLCDLAVSLPWSDINAALSCSADTQFFAPTLSIPYSPSVSHPQLEPASFPRPVESSLMDRFISITNCQLSLSYAHSIIDLSSDKMGDMALVFNTDFAHTHPRNDTLQPTVNPLMLTSPPDNDFLNSGLGLGHKGPVDPDISESRSSSDSERTLDAVEGTCENHGAIRLVVHDQGEANISVIDAKSTGNGLDRPGTPQNNIKLHINGLVGECTPENEFDLSKDSKSSDDESEDRKSIAGTSLDPTEFSDTADAAKVGSNNELSDKRHRKGLMNGKSTHMRQSVPPARSLKRGRPSKEPSALSGARNSRRGGKGLSSVESSKSSKGRDSATNETSPARGGDAKRSSKRRRLSSSPVFPTYSGTKDDPIDVDKAEDSISLLDTAVTKEYVKSEEITLPLAVNPPIKGTKSYTVFDATGLPRLITPSFHYEEHHHQFRQIFNRIEAFYEHGRPLHITRPGDSIVKIFTYEAWKDLKPVEIQQELRKKNVIVTGWPVTEQITFDEASITQLAGSPLTQISINDSSIAPCVDGYQASVVSGRVKDLLDNRHPLGKILNAIDIPLLAGDIKPAEHTSDLHAFRYTRGQHHIDLKYPYPTGHMRWALIGHENTMTFLHIDCDGLCTDVLVTDGGKVWVFLRERPTNPLSSIDFFLKDGFRLDEVVDSSEYDFEAVALRPRDRLFMKPCQPHMVFGYADTICLGGHYYLTNHMQGTLQGLIHSFVLHNFLTNTSHPTGVLLRRMVLFYHIGFLEGGVAESDPSAFHLPDINTIDGLLNLLCACVLVILGNVLDFRTYRAPSQEQDEMANREQEILISMDVNTIPHHDRIAICYSRGVALRLVDWICQRCVVTDPGGLVIDDLPSRFFVQIAQTLIKYKERANISTLDVEANITIDLLAKQIDNVVDIDHGFSSFWSKRHILPSDSLKLANQEGCCVQWPADTPRPDEPQQDFFQRGCTRLDTRFFDIMKARKHMEKIWFFPDIYTDHSSGQAN